MVIHEPGRHRNPSGFQDSGLNCQVNSPTVADCFPLISFPFICFCSICVTNPHLSILLAIGLRHMQRVTPPAWKKRFRYQTVYHAIGYRIAMCCYNLQDLRLCKVQVQKLVEMGFPDDMVRSALKSVNGDENMALEKLCSG